MRKFKCAVIQMQSILNDIDKNLQNSLALANQAITQGAKLIVFPELFVTGYCTHPNDKHFAFDLNCLDSPKNRGVLCAMLAVAKEHNVYIVGCGIEEENGELYDTAFILDSKGIVGKYRKIYLWSDEVERFCRGEDYPVFDIPFGDFSVKMGLQICYEIGFGEGVRFLALKGAEVVVIPAASCRSYVWDVASRARALENGLFVLAINRSGDEEHPYTKEKLEFAGKSKIINPRGEVLCEATKKNEVLVVEIDIDEVAKQRKAMPYLRDLNLSLVQKHFLDIANR